MTIEAEVKEQEEGIEATEKRLAAAGWPWPLAKATWDQFDYALMLRTGEVIHFSLAKEEKDAPEWVSLDVENFVEQNAEVYKKWFGPRRFGPTTFDRNIVVRLSDIVWCADAPHGS